MTVEIPHRLQNGAGNKPDAALWNDNYDWLTALTAGSLLGNAGFERWNLATSFSNPANGASLADSWTWVKSGSSPATIDVSREATLIDSQTYSAKVNVTGAGSSDSIGALKQTIGDYTKFAGHRLVFSAKVRVSTASKVRLRVTDGVSPQLSDYHTGGGTFELLQVAITTSSSLSELTVQVETTSDFTGAVYVDSCSLYAVPLLMSDTAREALPYSDLFNRKLSIDGGTMAGDLTIASNKLAITAAAGAGDPYVLFQVLATTSWSMGIDNSDSDTFKLSAAATLGSSDLLIITTAGLVAMGPNAAVGPAFSYQDNGTGDMRFLLYKNNTSGDPYVNFATNATNWSIGIDNSDSDKFKLSKASSIGTTDYIDTDGSGSVNFPQGSLSLTRAYVGNSVIYYADNTDNTNGASHAGILLRVGGTSGGDPFVRFDVTSGNSFTMGIDNSDGDLFMIRNSTSLGGAGVCIEASSHNLIPYADNSYKCGKTGNRWSEVWAGNGTIQTSSLSTKKSIKFLGVDDCKVPRAIAFNRPWDKHSAPQIGFAADDLPDECFAVVNDKGERSKEDVYTSAVIGMLCQAVRNDYERFKAIEDRIAKLEKN